MPLLPGEWEQWREGIRSDPHDIRIAVSAKSDSTVAPLLAAGRDVAALLVAYERGEIDVIGARHLVRAGKAHLWIGLTENEWLEVKGSPYQINAPGPQAPEVDRASPRCGSVRQRGPDAILVIGFRERMDGKAFRLDQAGTCTACQR